MRKKSLIIGGNDAYHCNEHRKIKKQKLWITMSMWKRKWKRNYL